MADDQIARTADCLADAFDSYTKRFWELTARAEQRFFSADWRGVMLDARARLDAYRASVDVASRQIRDILGERADRPETWAEIKPRYLEAHSGRYDADLSLTFFNSMARGFLRAAIGHVKFEVDHPVPHPPASQPLLRSYEHRADLVSLTRQIFVDMKEAHFYEDVDRDARRVADHIRGFLLEVLVSDAFDGIDVIRSLFFRNKAAFVIGRIRVGQLVMPLAILLRNGGHGAYVHLVMLEEVKAGRLFSNTRSNFHTDIRDHRELVGFLRDLLPEKHVYELYAGIGYYNHARSEFYDDLMSHLSRTGERFVKAPGARGKVLAVFTLPSYPMVFKVLRDEFEPPKTVSRDAVIRRYSFVRRADRAGRMLDALRFEDVRFARGQFASEVLSELLQRCSQSVVDRGETIEVRLFYAQKKVVPLPEYLGMTKNVRLQRDAIVDLGYLVKDLLSANIFVGDYLLKNFGVTSYGRVASFDFDELDLVTNQRFRELPSARDDEEEWSGSHIESLVVGENDIFPEEWEHFLGIPRYLMPAFKASHADLFTATYYREIQKRLREEEILDLAGVDSLETRLSERPSPRDPA